MKVRELLSHWEETAHGELTEEICSIRLTLEDAARLKALAEMFPRRRIEDLISDLLGSALDDLEGALPYVRGEEVIGRDELGDPLYEDVGPTPKYLKLTKKHIDQLHRNR